MKNKPPRARAFLPEYQEPSYWDARTPLVSGRGLARALNAYADLNDNRLRRELFLKGGFKLDAGCGAGRLLGHASVGVDFSAGMLVRAKAARPGRELVRASLTDLPFRDGAFDYAYSVDTLPHFDPAGRRRMAAEVRRVSKDAALLWARMSYFRLPHAGRLRGPVALLASFFADRLGL